MFIYFPHRLGQLRNGVQYSPSYFRKRLQHHDFINVVCDNTEDERFKKMRKNLEYLYTVNAATPGRKFNVGGDHSMSIATVASSLNQQPSTKVIWFDAHPDINTFKSSQSKNVHGMPLAYLTGLCDRLEFDFLNVKLPFENILYVGIRDIDEFERETIRNFGIETVTCYELNHDPYTVKQRIDEFIADDPVHLSFDVDCMDPTIIPCTGTRCGGGLNFNVKEVLDHLLDKNVINIDLTEINLSLGNEAQRETTMANVLYLFDSYLKVHSLPPPHAR